MVCTILLGTIIGIIAGYSRGIVDEVLMRFCDIMLSFPSKVMILAIVGVLGVGIENIIFANIIIKWTWYARMIRGIVIQYRYKNYMLYSKVINTKKSFDIFNITHPISNVASTITSDNIFGSRCLNITKLFLVFILWNKAYNFCIYIE